MNRPLLIAVTMASLLIGAIAAYTLTSRPAPSNPPAQASGGADAPDVAALEKRVEALEAEVHELRVAMRHMETPSRTPAAIAAGRTGEPSAALQKINEVDGAIEDRVANELETEGSQVRERVQELVRDEMAVAEEEAFQRRQERVRESIGARVDEFAEAQGLNDQQRDKLKNLVVEERTQVMSTFRDANRNGLSFDEARDKVVELREKTDAQAKALLDKDQYEAYLADREEEMSRRFGRFGGRGGRPGPPPGP